MLRNLLAEFFPNSGNKAVRESPKGKFAALESLQRRIRAAGKDDDKRPRRKVDTSARADKTRG